MSPRFQLSCYRKAIFRWVMGTMKWIKRTEEPRAVRQATAEVSAAMLPPKIALIWNIMSFWNMRGHILRAKYQLLPCFSGLLQIISYFYRSHTSRNFLDFSENILLKKRSRSSQCPLAELYQMSWHREIKANVMSFTENTLSAGWRSSDVSTAGGRKRSCLQNSSWSVS